MSHNYKIPPVFNDKKPYNRYVDELKAWTLLIDLEKQKQGIAVALSLPKEDSTQVRDKVFSEISIADLNKEDGIDTLIAFMDNLFKKDELTDMYKHYTNFDRYKRKSDETMESYIIEFEKLCNKTKKFDMALPESVLAFKLLDGACLKHSDRKLVLTGVNYEEVNTMFKQMKSALKKFFGEQSLPTNSNESIKVEPSITKTEPVFITGTHGNLVRPRNERFRYGNRNNYERNNQRPLRKRNNPLDEKGEPLRCHICQSVMHFARFCPHGNKTFDKPVFQASDENDMVEKAVLFTGAVIEDKSVLLSEALNCVVLDSACSATVTGEDWLKCYLDSLTTEQKCKIQRSPSDTVFRFGGGERLKSNGKVKIPCNMAGKECEIVTDIVECDIPLLLSKTAMKKADMKLDLVNDTAEIFGTLVDLQNTTSGHYCVPLKEDEVCLSNSILINESFKEKEKKVVKLHKQFGHPTAKRLASLLVDAKLYDEDCKRILDQIEQDCETWKKFKRTQPRPVVSLPLATDFNQCVVMDLKEWVKSKIWLFYLIDTATRFTLATVIRSKLPSVIIDKTMQLWIGNGFGVPGRLLADNGGEFANEEYRDMCDNLNIEVLNTAACSPWQNGLCERNHAIVDDCLRKILDENPKLSLEVGLVWALNAKNSLHMNSGYSSCQLVFGRNPNLPSVLNANPPALEGVTVSFIEAEASERVRRALRHQSTNTQYYTGEKVYYKRDDSPKWRGPAKVIGQDGKNKLDNTDLKENKDVGDHQSEVVIDLEVEESNATPVQQEQRNRSEHEENVSDVPEAEMNLEGEQQVSVRKEHDFPKVNDHVEVKMKDVPEWFSAKVISRGGKATGKYSSWYNIRKEGTNDEMCLDFKDVEEWKKVESVNVVILPEHVHDTVEAVKAKQKELDNWKLFDVVRQVPDDKQIVKARLVVRGFEEEHKLQRDSPTAAKDTLRMFFGIAACKNWNCVALDVKSAFLQGHTIDRDVYVTPPKEANVPDGFTWKLVKVIYGLNDAPRNWYFSVRQTLLKLKAEQSTVDKALFYWKDTDNNLCGIFIMHVDDFVLAGNKIFEASIMSQLIKTYKVGKIEETNFKYIGINISQDGGNITMDQKQYVECIQEIQISNKRSTRKRDELNDDVLHELRSAIGQLNWIATQTRPDLAFDVLELNVSIKNGRVEHLLVANKVIKKMKATNNVCLIFPNMPKYELWKLVVFSDASYANLPDGVSSAGGSIVIVVAEDGKCFPISWCSKKIKRVVKSTIAAEALSLVNGIDNAYYIGCLMSQILFSQRTNENCIPITAYIDNKSLYENIHATTLVSEKRLRIDIAAIQQMVNEGKVSVRWVPASLQLSDGMTKRGASLQRLMNVLTNGKITFD
ncbi:uncharacterized protein LOC130636814 [Hydractinia symbiolongicarpus]|uniref:uncharacterized protein LOC130636814 n=1 Tax=Hydractinia symbiolongicarpus TaxID=13093 RepID=UPI00254E35F7|nr:uncharacterized protein LOC130636814 [Hydractinia symbiolongicarpus]